MDDPTTCLLEVASSWVNTSKKRASYPPSFSLSQEDLSKDITENIISQPLSRINNYEATYVCDKKYNQLQQLKNAFGTFGRGDIFAISSLLANPYEGIGNSIFFNEDAVKIGNMDAVFNLTGHNGGYFLQATMAEANEFNVDRVTTLTNKQTAIQIGPAVENTEDWTFADIAGGPGGFSQYLRWRRPTSTGYGITLLNTSDNLKWLPELRNDQSFNIYDRDDGSGDIYKYHRKFCDYVLESEENGVNLVLADGGFEGSSQEELFTAHLLMLEILMAIKIVRFDDYNRGTIVIKMLDTYSQFMAELLYLVARVFEKVWLFKPITSHSVKSEKYLVARNPRPNQRLKVIQILENAARTFDQYKIPVSLLDSKNKPPSEFLVWLRQINEKSVEKQITATSAINNYIHALTYYKKLPDNEINKLLSQPISVIKQPLNMYRLKKSLNVPLLKLNQQVAPPLYDTYKALVVWNLPGNVDDRFIPKNATGNSGRDTRRKPRTPGAKQLHAKISSTGKRLYVPRISTTSSHETEELVEKRTQILTDDIASQATEKLIAELAQKEERPKFPPIAQIPVTPISILVQPTQETPLSYTSSPQISATLPPQQKINDPDVAATSLPTQTNSSIKLLPLSYNTTQSFLEPSARPSIPIIQQRMSLQIKPISD